MVFGIHQHRWYKEVFGLFFIPVLPKLHVTKLFMVTPKSLLCMVGGSICDMSFPMTIIQQLVKQKPMATFCSCPSVLSGPSATFCFYVVCFSGVNTNRSHFSTSFITMLNGCSGTPLMTSFCREDYLFLPLLPSF